MVNYTICTVIFAFVVIATCDGLSTTSRRLQDNNQKKNWWELGLADPILDETALYYLGQTYYQASDVAEVLETMSRTNSSDPMSWTMEWRETAARLEGLGQEQMNAGHHRSAGFAHLRASTYLRASLHRHPDPYHPEVKDLAQRAVDNFESFLHLADYPCGPVRIPYENDETLPGYLCLNRNTEGTKAPVILFNEGKDGWAEDGKFVVDEAMQRGYHVLLWDGPGMGKTIRLQNLPFRHDWENVLSPVIDFVSNIPEVDEDRLALISVSLGGFLGPRAAIFEHRLKALVANPGVLTWYKVYEDFLNSIDPALVQLCETDPDAFDETMAQMMENSDFLRWGLVDSMWHHGVDKPSALMKEISLYNIEGMLDNYTTATLVIDAEAEERAQAKELYAAIPDWVEKKYLYFTADEAAQFHCQPGATAIWSMRMFDWLDEVLFGDKLSNTGASELTSTSSGGLAVTMPSFLSGLLILSATLFI